MELNIVKFFNRLGRGTVLDELTDFVSRIFYLSAFWTVFTIAIFFFAENGRIIATALTIAAGLHFLISEGLLKYLLVKYLKKIRPYVTHPNEVFPIGRKHNDSSFPSSHMSAILSILTVLIYFYPGTWLVLLLLVLFMAFARLHNGMHYPSDVIAGSILGILYGAAGVYSSEIVLGLIF